jgi:hypothetical protein
MKNPRADESGVGYSALFSWKPSHLNINPELHCFPIPPKPIIIVK